MPLSTDHRSLAARGTVSLAALAMLSGCMSSTTYGTGTPPERQLLVDIVNVVSLGAEEPVEIDYSPRAGLVVPPRLDGALPPPETQVAATTGVDNFPVDPEVQQAEALAAWRADPRSQDPMSYRLPAGSTTVRKSEVDPATPLTPKQIREQGAAFRKQLAAFDGSGTERRFLTDPPEDYRQPATGQEIALEDITDTEPRPDPRKKPWWKLW